MNPIKELIDIIRILNERVTDLEKNQIKVAEVRLEGLEARKEVLEKNVAFLKRAQKSLASVFGDENRIGEN